MRKCTEIQENEIIQLYNQGLSMEKICLKFNVSRPTIGNILRRREITLRTASERMRIYNVDHDSFSEINTPESAYWLGWIYTDGYNSSDHNYIKLSIQLRDIEVLENFKLFLKSDYPIHIVHQTKRQNSQSLCNLMVTSKKISQDLEKWGAPQNKTFLIKWPLFLEKDLVRNFLLGVLEGDGCISGRVCSIIGTSDFVNGMNKFLKENLNIEGSISQKHPGKDTYTLRLESRYKSLTFLNWLYKDVEIKLERKYNKYLDLLNEDPLCPPLLYDDGSRFSKADKLKRRYFKSSVKKSMGNFIVPIPSYEKPQSVSHLQYEEFQLAKEAFIKKKKSK